MDLNNEECEKHVDNLEERLANLNPSHQLLQYYRKKICDFVSENSIILNRLEKYNDSCVDQVIC
ncbi:hypothetical protein A3Q56_08259, partial [Intoshia linei]